MGRAHLVMATISAAVGAVALAAAAFAGGGWLALLIAAIFLANALTRIELARRAPA